MIRKILTTTAIVAIMTSGAAYAANDQANPAPAANAEMTGADTSGPDSSGMPIFSGREAANAGAYYTVMPGQVLASALIGKSVYHGTGETAEAVGDVNDIVMSKDGSAEAVVIGVGGFLGIGEKNVAVSFDRLVWITKDGETWLTISATKQDLENAPAFVEERQSSAIDSVATDVVNEVVSMTDSKTMTDDKAMTDDEAMKTDERAMDSDATPTDVTATSVEEPAATGTTMAVTPTESLPADQVQGAPVFSAGNEEIGEVDTLIMTSGDTVKAYIVDVGGFLGMNEKPVAIAPEAVSIVTDKDGNVQVRTPFSRETLERHAAYSKQDFEDNPDKVLIR